MKVGLFTIVLLIAAGCGKENKPDSCNSSQATVRKIVDKKAVVRVTDRATEPVYLVEAGTIDSRLIPCTLALEYYLDGLEVTISGEVKAAVHLASTPCCAAPIVLTKISK
ncbi:hypothetical protein [Flavihumibacter sp. CACIAM 22H1]|uniref:hypothetical protein n=1 Tax=Flavihumibacter sp. CACIAM 22H1 TaxID=1812911 RepID=UPI0007A8CFA5|nr:hypothetical protein [Flavihumibacter sp. CACIAM 22H1]KYP15742.1 MAG: hypothetical protein A1D16_05210 [Flavihumibacter sp. CACIAM 22H1]